MQLCNPVRQQYVIPLWMTPRWTDDKMMERLNREIGEPIIRAHAFHADIERVVAQELCIEKYGKGCIWGG